MAATRSVSRFSPNKLLSVLGILAGLGVLTLLTSPQEFISNPGPEASKQTLVSVFLTKDQTATQGARLPKRYSNSLASFSSPEEAFTKPEEIKINEEMPHLLHVPLDDDDQGLQPVRFYLYDEPEINTNFSQCVPTWKKRRPPHKWAGMDSEKHGPQHQFIKRLRSHPWRVRDGTEAQIFVVPIDIDEAFYYKGGDCPEPYSDYMWRAVNAVKNSEWFKRKNGRDHLWVTHHWKWASWAFVARTPKEISRRTNNQITFEQWRARPCLLHRRRTRDKCAWDATDIQNAADHVHRQSSNMKGISGTEFGLELYGSRFCLVLRCDDPDTSRFYDCIAAGSIPVIVSDGWNLFVNPFASLLNIQEYGVMISERVFTLDTFAAVSYLARMPEIELRRKFDAMMRARRALVWRHPRTLAPDYTIAEAYNACLKGQEGEEE